MRRAAVPTRRPSPLPILGNGDAMFKKEVVSSTWQPIP
jgi:hypothetical protein